MIMPAGRHLLLPANPRFIAASLLVGLLLNMLLGFSGWHWVPDLLIVVVVFWNVHQPRRVGLLLSFFLGLALDVHESALLGQSALSYVVISSLAITIHRRLLWFTLRKQALQMAPLFVLAALIEWVTRLVVQDAAPHWSQIFAPFLQAALWPVIGHVLLAPQRRAVDPDNIRPL
jgi:rod shape-determining protein MreD